MIKTGLALGLGALLLGALLLGLCARGGAAHALVFVALLPWLYLLDQQRSLRATLVWAWAMAVVFTGACFAWFGAALGSYVQIGAPAGVALLLLLAPLFQPQILVFAALRFWVGRRAGPLLAAVAGAAAWVGTEWLYPKLLGDTLGHGLYPSPLLRQAAALGGAALLTLAVLAVNEALWRAWSQRAAGAVRVAGVPLALALGLPGLLLLFGWQQMPGAGPAEGPTLRVGLVQANQFDYEARRQRDGAYAVVREVLNTHYAMSHDAVERQGAELVLWTETAYPTPFGRPKSAAGAELDREILSIVQAAGVPFVFGTYDRDDAGEYNAAAFVTPQAGLLGHYRKTRLFPYSEYLPDWAEGLRPHLPGAGAWKPGNGARVFPLPLKGGRELPVQALICLDDVDVGLALDGARLGARALLTLSNDAWFTAHSQGAELHLAVAAFRSIETGLPQFRVTTNGASAVIDAQGRVRARGASGEQVLVMGELPVPVPAPTLMVRWGDWVGPAALVALVAVLLGLFRPHGRSQIASQEPAGSWPVAARWALLPAPARWGAALLRALARISLLGLALLLLWDANQRSQTLMQLRWVLATVLLPEAAAWCLLQAYAHPVEQQGERLRLAGLELMLSAAQPWRWPLPGAGLSLATAQGTLHLLPLRPRRGLQRAELKFLLLPLLLALPAFLLHQHIAYGSWVGEWHSFGPLAYARALGLWWAAWAVGVLVCAALLRVAIEVAMALVTRLRPAWQARVRRQLERAGLALIYLGLPAWLALRMGA